MQRCVLAREARRLLATFTQWGRIGFVLSRQIVAPIPDPVYWPAIAAVAMSAMLDIVV
jgi:hypothetical protein